MEVEGKVMWLTILGMDREMIGEGRRVRTWTGHEHSGDMHKREEKS